MMEEEKEVKKAVASHAHSKDELSSHGLAYLRDALPTPCDGEITLIHASTYRSCFKKLLDEASRIDHNEAGVWTCEHIPPDRRQPTSRLAAPEFFDNLVTGSARAPTPLR